MDRYVCADCGAPHEGLPTSFGWPLPDCVAALAPDEQARRAEIEEETCVLDGEHFFVRANLEVAVRDARGVVSWTVWSTLSRANFERTLSLWSTPGRESEPPYFGWLSNAIPGFPPTSPLAVHVVTQPVGVRPLLHVLDEQHPLWVEQQEGVDSRRADELLHAAWARCGPT